MKYFSGFCLSNESELFDFWLDKCSDYCVAGFSYGAIKAVKYCLETQNRIDRLILLSPAFFNDKDEKFKRSQLLYFKKNSKLYIKNFIKNISNGSKIDLSKYITSSDYNQLKELLYYQWDIDKLNLLSKKGIKIEVILGENDKIIDAKKAKDFFEKASIVYFIKNANHILKAKDEN